VVNPRMSDRALIHVDQTGPIRNVDNGLETVQHVEGDIEYDDPVEVKSLSEPVCGGQGTRTLKSLRTTVFKYVVSRPHPSLPLAA
jgi:5,10-methylene-tetrahydrofolate dehydrogenase/methenyl tetrahydrofolate cyclohydrolase